MQVTPEEFKLSYQQIEDNRLDFVADALLHCYRQVTDRVPSNELWQKLRNVVEYESL